MRAWERGSNYCRLPDEQYRKLHQGSMQTLQETARCSATWTPKQQIRILTHPFRAKSRQRSAWFFRSLVTEPIKYRV